MVNVAEKLRQLRVDRLGISLAKFSKAMGYATPSGTQRYFSDEFSDRPLPDKIVSRLRLEYIGQGTPPIQDEEILELAEPGYMDRHRSVDAPIVVQGYPKEAIINLIREMADEGILPPNDDNDSTVGMVLALLDDHVQRLQGKPSPLEQLKRRASEAI